MQPLSVLLTAEGTYPHYPGGVTVWCDQLIRQLPDLQFHVLSITHSPSQQVLADLPPNVASLLTLPLWGTEEPGMQDGAFSAVYRRKLKTSPKAVSSGFTKPFEAVVQSLLASKFPEALAEALLALHIYFQEYDFSYSMTSDQAWDVFLGVCSARLGGKLNLEDATNYMRWLRRYLAVVSIPYPQVDIVHSSMAGLAGIAGVLQKGLAGSGFLLSEHGIYLRELYINLSRSEYNMASKRFLLTLNESIVKMNYHFADQVSSLCEFNKKWQVRLGAEAAKVAVVPNGCDAAVFHPGKASAPRPLTVLTMARISPLKGIDVLIRAAAAVRAAIPEVRFRILGQPADKEYFQKCLELADRLDVSSALEFGVTSDSPAAYREADIFCLPSISEAMPYSILEAMLSGCPVVATDTGGISEMLAGCGVVVRPNDANALAEGILSLLQGVAGSSRRELLSRTALIRARERYTVQKCSGHFREIYDDLADANRNVSTRYAPSARSLTESAA